MTLGALEPVPPALRHRLRGALAHAAAGGLERDDLASARLARVIEDGEPWFGAEPSLAELGYWMIDGRHAVAVRAQGCRWLAMFPSAETAARLARLVTDPATPAPVREQAIRTLGDRQLRGRHPSTQWSADALGVADEALATVADAMTAAGTITSAELPRALRHVDSELLAAIIARSPGLWGDALESFASAPLARVLFVSIGDIPTSHRVRVLRLIGATLGEEAVPLLVSRAADAPPDERLEMLFLAVSLGGEPHLGRLEDALRGARFAAVLRQRAAWHLAHRGLVPTVRGLRVARTTAVLPRAERAARCAQAADDLGALTTFGRHPERYLYTQWAWMVRAAEDPARARALVRACPAAQRLVRELHLDDLARRGRVAELTAAAQALHAPELGALQLAIWGRPLAALELAATARRHTPELVCARALACYRAGRPELTARILAEDLPPSELVGDAGPAPFPGPHEQWMIAHAPTARPALAALAAGVAGVLGLARPAPYDAEPDRPSLAGTRAVVERLDRGLHGASVYLAGDLTYMDRDAITAAIAQAGARVVSGPLPGTDYYVPGEDCGAELIARLELAGARRLGRDELAARSRREGPLDDDDLAREARGGVNAAAGPRQRGREGPLEEDEE